MLKKLKASPLTVIVSSTPTFSPLTTNPAGFVVSGENVGVDETITVSGEALSFLSTGIDTRVYYIKNF